MKRFSRKSIIAVLAVIAVVIIGFGLYIMPSKWLPVSDSTEVYSMIITDVKNHVSAETVNEQKIDEVLTLIKHTPTMKRKINPGEIDFMGPDEGYRLTFNLIDGDPIEIYYSFLKGGLVKSSPKVQNISFGNKKLVEIFEYYTESDSNS